MCLFKEIECRIYKDSVIRWDRHTELFTAAFTRTRILMCFIHSISCISYCRVACPSFIHFILSRVFNVFAFSVKKDKGPPGGEDKRKTIKTLIDKIPTSKHELFNYPIDSSLVDAVSTL